jgi:hypothetical protein
LIAQDLAKLHSVEVHSRNFDGYNGQLFKTAIGQLRVIEVSGSSCAAVPAAIRKALGQTLRIAWERIRPALKQIKEEEIQR